MDLRVDPRELAARTASLPFRLPRALTVRRVTVMGGALGATLVTAAWVPGMFGRGGDTGPTTLIFAVSVLASTLVLTGVLLDFVTRVPPVSGAGPVRLIFGGPGLGAVNGALALLALLFADHVHEVLGGGRLIVENFDLRTIVIGLAFAGIMGGVFGGVYTVAFVPLVAWQRVYVTRPSHDAVDRMLVVVGAWMLVVALLCFGLAGLDQLSHPRPLWEAGSLLVACPAFFTATIGVGALALGLWRLVARRAWLARVKAGLVTEWSVVPRASVTGVDDARLVPLLRTSARLVGAEDVLAWSDRAKAAYREPERMIAVALVR